MFSGVSFILYARSQKIRETTKKCLWEQINQRPKCRLNLNISGELFLSLIKLHHSILLICKTTERRQPEVLT